MTVAIETINLGKNFGKVPAVKNLNLRVMKGELFGLLGPNGSGKTTTIKMLTGLLTPTAGEVKVLDGKYTPTNHEYRQKIGATFTGSLYERLTSRENLQFFSSLYQGKDIHSPDEVLQMVDLEDTGRKTVKHFSRGMRQRLELARALINKPQFLFLDEPTLGLDPLGARKLRQVIKNIVDSRVTVFLTTHYMEEADELCHRIGFLNQGQLVAVDSPQNLKKRYGRNEWNVVIEEEGQTRELFLPREKENHIVELLNCGKLRSLRLGEATLEDVYVRLTGKELAS
ncbi:ABC transporter ATP-binding protein [Candidatus Contubernalis alkaliaceticus]|uniref:ABC transporter ATP-binding protein n=1 Tax=Candidatus Contubernalis alkaliaceticus TaxID=338645 RepID=UPI001F4BE37F|nr:ABC transporter ATP-binding protein [Candidatus Contubernalis alkalaceticus]UNC92158.1 ABC transporter ATP-binding protein [Candidatus Contubernalis alkalaceticus]